MNRFVFADILRVLATFSVVVIHVVGYLFNNFSSLRSDYWWISNFWMNSTKWSVPMFVMLSGMFLLDPNKNISISSMFFKRTLKILIPLIFWGFFYETWQLLIIQHQKTFPLSEIAIKIYQGQVEYHLWFLYMLLGLYLFTPILRTYILAANVNNIKYFILCWFTVNGIIGAIENIFQLKAGLDLRYFSGYIGYYILGYYLYNHHQKIKLKVYIFSLLTLLITSVICTYLFAKYGLNYIAVTTDYLSAAVILISSVIFMLIKSINWENILSRFLYLKILIEDLSKNSYGIYLVHVLILGLANSRSSPVKLNAEFIHPLIGIPVTTFSVVLISYLVVKCLKRVKYVQFILP